MVQQEYKTAHANDPFCETAVGLRFLRRMAMGRLVMSMCVAWLLAVPGHAWAGTCQVEGPSLADTRQYIINALHTAGTDVFDIGVNDENRVFIFTGASESVPNSGWYPGAQFPSHHTVGVPDETAPLNVLDCSTSGIETRSYGFIVFVRCAAQQHCVNVHDDSQNANALGIHYSGDNDHAQRLAAAFSHYIYLLQQDWKKSHDDPNDPFKKPPQ